MNKTRTSKPTGWNPPDTDRYLTNLKKLHGGTLTLKTGKPAKDSKKQGQP